MRLDRNTITTASGAVTATSILLVKSGYYPEFFTFIAATSHLIGSFYTHKPNS